MESVVPLLRLAVVCRPPPADAVAERNPSPEGRAEGGALRRPQLSACLAPPRYTAAANVSPRSRIESRNVGPKMAMIAGRYRLTTS